MCCVSRFFCRYVNKVRMTTINRNYFLILYDKIYRKLYNYGLPNWYEIIIDRYEYKLNLTCIPTKILRRKVLLLIYIYHA